MPTVAWFHSNADPLTTGELRRLALPAALLEQRGWRCRFEPASGWSQTASDIAVVPVSALPSLARTSDWGSLPSIIVDFDDDATTRDGRLLDGLLLAAGRIDAVATRGPLASRWAASNLASAAYCAPICDIAERNAELRAAALRFSLPRAAASAPCGEPQIVWFAEPGDYIAEEEVAFVLDTASQAVSSRRRMHVIAPRPQLDWLDQAGLPPEIEREVWSGRRIEHLLTARTEIALPVLETTKRRHAKLFRYGIRTDISGHDAEDFEPGRVAADWDRLFRQHLPRPVHAVPERRRKLLIFVDLIQDVELVLPIIDAALESGKLELRVAATSWLVEQSPRLLRELKTRKVEPEIYDRKLILGGLGLSLQDVDALLTMVETTLNVHKRAHMLTLRAQSLGIPTFTLQHGLENVGLTYFDEVHDHTVEIHSDHIFVWFPLEDAPSVVPERVRPRLIHVGRPRMASQVEQVSLPIANCKKLIAIFENLHWARYNRTFRDNFMADCFAVARAMEDAVLVLKPHPAGQWSSKVRGSIADWPVNVVLADPSNPEWSAVPAAALIAAADAVITTPSSVAVDAAFQGKRVAIAGYNIDVSLYAPLPILRSFEDWLSFVSAYQNDIRVAQVRARFLSRMNISGPSEQRVVKAIETILVGRLRKTNQ